MAMVRSEKLARIRAVILQRERGTEWKLERRAGASLR